MAGSGQRYLNSQPGSRDDQFHDRKLLRDMEASGVEALGLVSDHLEEVYVQIPVNDGSGWQSTCKIIRPRGPTQPNTKRRLIVLFHVGGCNRGSPEMFTRPGREFALAFDAVVVSVEYRLAPEHPWPTGLLDAWDVCAHLTEAAFSGNSNDNSNGNDKEKFGANVKIDISGIIIGGASAGANLACAIMSLSLITMSNSQTQNDIIKTPRLKKTTTQNAHHRPIPQRPIPHDQRTTPPVVQRQVHTSADQPTRFRTRARNA